MKIAFINPPLLSPGEMEERENKYLNWINRGNMYIKPFEPPFGITTLATILRQRNHEVRLIDGTGALLSLHEVISEIESFKPEVIGISSLTPNYPNALMLARRIRKDFPEAVLVLGGVHPTVFPEEVLEECDAHFVVAGEGEIAFLEVVENLGSPSSRLRKGVIRSPRLIEGENIIFPDYDLLPVHNYLNYTQKLRKIKSLPVIVTRGCPYSCSFCAVGTIMGKRWRAMPPGRSAEKIAELAEKFSLEGIWFKDSILNLNRKWIDEFSLHLHKLLPDLKWQMNTRADLIREEEIETLSQRGLVQVDLGIEAGTDKSLKILKKGITVETVRKAVKILKKYVRVAGFFMIGIPGETEEDIYQTVSFAKELQLDSYSWSIFQPLPGSELFEMLVKKCGTKIPDWKTLIFTDTECSWCEVPPQRLKEIYEEINRI